MSEVPDRVRRAFVDHSGFEAGPAGDYVSTATPFDARVTVEPADGLEDLLSPEEYREQTE